MPGPAYLQDDEVSDDHLVAALHSGGDEARFALTDLMRRHGERLLSALRPLCNRDEASDIAQDVWTRVWSSPPQHGSQFFGFLYRVGINLIRTKRRRQPMTTLPDNDLLPELTDVIDARIEALLACLAKLDQDSRTLLELGFTGVSGDDLATQFGVLRQTISNRIFALKNRLRDCIVKRMQ